MKVELLDSTSSGPSAEMSYKTPIVSSTPPARRWRISIAFSLGVLVLLASFAIAAISLHSHASPSTPPTLAPAAAAESKRWYSLGYVDIEGGVTPLYPVQMGRVKSIEAKENESVKAGAELFHLDDQMQRLTAREAENDLDAARKKMAIAEAGVEEADKQMKAQKTAIAEASKKVEMARILLEKQRRFVKEGIEGDKESLQAAEKNVERADLGVKGEQEKLAVLEAVKHKAEGYVAAAKVNVEAKQTQLEKARQAVSECIVRAPVDGTPLRILITVGETLGANPHQPAIQFAADRPPMVRAEVDQESVDHVKSGQQVIIQDSVTEQEFARGKVVRIARWYAPRRSMNAEILAATSDNRTVECIIYLEPTSRPVRIGQRVRVQFPD